MKFKVLSVKARKVTLGMNIDANGWALEHAAERRVDEGYRECRHRESADVSKNEVRHLASDPECEFHDCVKNRS